MHNARVRRYRRILSTTMGCFDPSPRHSRPPTVAVVSARSQWNACKLLPVNAAFHYSRPGATEVWLLGMPQLSAQFRSPDLAFLIICGFIERTYQSSRSKGLLHPAGNRKKVLLGLPPSDSPFLDP
jgi:hypothetical protein